MTPAFGKTAAIVGAFIAAPFCAAAPADGYQSTAAVTPSSQRGASLDELTLLAPMRAKPKAPFKAELTVENLAEQARTTREIEENPDALRFQKQTALPSLNLLSSAVPNGNVVFKTGAKP